MRRDDMARGLLRPDKRFGFLLSARMGVTACDVIVDHAHGLHERVDRGGSHELPTALLQVLGKGHAFCGLAQCAER